MKIRKPFLARSVGIPVITSQYLTGWYKAGQKLPGDLVRTRSTVIDHIFVCHRGELSKNPGNRA